MVFKKIDKLEAYKTYGTRIGANANNKEFERFVFKKIPNKFTILNIKLIDERIKLAAKFLNGYKRKSILLVSTLDSAYYSVYNFSKLMGISVNFGRYLAGSAIIGMEVSSDLCDTTLSILNLSASSEYSFTLYISPT